MNKKARIPGRAAALLSAAAVFVSVHLPFFSAAAAPDVGLFAKRGDKQAFMRGKYSLSLPEFRTMLDDGGEPGDAAPGGVYAEIHDAVDLYGNADSLPSSFSLRDNGTMTPVRNQSGFGTCWTHSAIASAESSVFRFQPSVDLSEFHTAYFTYYPSDGSMTDKEILNRGGTADYVINLWANGIGPVSEKLLPYGDLDTLSDVRNDVWAGSSEFRLENAYTFDYSRGRTNEAEVNSLVKQFVYSGMAVDVSFLSDSANSFNRQYSSTNSRKPPRFANHSVAIAGWDDSFPKENFNIQPENDGAWLVKNSWGSGYGNGGYMWISYEDRSLSEFAVFQLGDADDFGNIHSVDHFVPTQSLSAHDDSNTGKPSYMANIFTACQNEYLGAIGTYIREPDTSYEITVYTGLTNPADPSSGTPSAATSGVCRLTGYQTLRLDEFIMLPDNEKFSVVVKLYSPESDYVIPVECCISVTDSETGEVTSLGSYATYEEIMANTMSGESFYSADGESWTDLKGDDYHYAEEEEQYLLDSIYIQLTDGIDPDDSEEMANIEKRMDYFRDLFAAGAVTAVMGNISMKAFTSCEGEVNYSRMGGLVYPGEVIELYAVGGGDIYYTADGADEVLYTDPIIITEETNIDARTEVDILHHAETFAPAAAPLISLDYLTGSSTDESDAKELTIFEPYFIKDHISIMTDGGEQTLRLRPVSNGEIYVDGKKVESGEFSEPLDISEVITEHTIEVHQEGWPDNNICLTVFKQYVSIDTVSETVSLAAGATLTAPDGTLLSSGDSVSEYAGQSLTLTVPWGSDVFTDTYNVPIRPDISQLRIDFREEALTGISFDYAGSLQFAVGSHPAESDWKSAEMRLYFSDSDDTGTLSFDVIPGETLSLRVVPEEYVFAAAPVTYVIPEAPEAPAAVPEYTTDGRAVVIADEDYESAILADAYGHFLEGACDRFGYNDLDRFTELMKQRYGTEDTQMMMNAMAARWNGDDVPETGAPIGIRFAATDSSFASEVLYTVVYAIGDINRDGFVDSADASEVLVHYADISTGGTGTIGTDLRRSADIDESGLIDSNDASLILNIYAALATS